MDLRIDQVGSHDDFFELGGDSLLAIQVVTRLHRSGLKISVGTLYQHPTLAGLASACSAGALETAPGGPAAVGDLPIVPGQAWFLEQGLLAPHLWHEGHVLQASGHLDIQLLRRVFTLIVTHHHALRTRFEQRTQWTQQIVDDESHELLSEVTAGDRLGAVETDGPEGIARGLQRQLSLERGPLWRAALIVGEHSDQLVLVGHHLVLDGFSWRIVLEDIQSLYRQLQMGAEAAPQQTHSFRSWALALEARAARLDTAEELAFWSSIARTPFCQLPRYAPGPPSAESVQSVYRSLGPATTARAQAAAGRASLLALLVSAWIATARALGESDAVVVDLLSHGRVERSLQLSVGRTVGRFSTVYPLRVSLGENADLPAALAATQQALALTSERGFDYGLLLHLSPSEQVRTHLRDLPKPDVCFNYAGQFDASLLDDSPFCALSEIPRSSSLRMTGERRYVLEINCGVMGGQLQFEWRFSANVLQPEAVQAWSEQLVTRLESLACEVSPRSLPIAAASKAEVSEELTSCTAV